jgi:hypothetical protein
VKVCILTTGTNNVPPIIDPLADLGNEIVKIIYDEMTHAEHDGDLLARVEAANPDWVLHVGAIPEHHGKPVPTSKHFAQIGARWKLVHLCFDGAEPVWWPHIQDYYDRGRFALQVNIDGVRIGPIGERGLTALCPVTTLDTPDWTERPIMCGFTGGLHGGRWEVIEPLIRQGLLTYRPRDNESPFTHFNAFLSMCKVGLNVATTGGHAGKHVKARTLELAAMGCLVLETAGSPLGDWFTEGEDFLAYQTPDDAADKIRWAQAHPREAAVIAESMRRKVTVQHSHAAFWSQVMERIGVGKALSRLKEPPLKHWQGPSSSTHAGPAHVAGPTPHLIEAIRMHNLVAFQDRVWIIPQGLGTIDLSNPTHRAHKAIRSAATLEEARASA